MRLLLPFGFYGAGNIGDESTLQGFARLLSRYQHEMRVWVASRNPLHTARVEPSFKYYKVAGRDLRWSWARYRSVAHVIAGGTPIMDILGAWPLGEVAPLVSAAYKQRKPIVFVGSGTEKLQREESRRVVSDVLAPKVRHWSVRCEHDKERLTDYGVTPENITVAADLAWLLEPVSDNFGKERLKLFGLNGNDPFVGVNVNNERFVLEQEPLFCEKVGMFLDSLIDRYGVRILFFCNEVRETETFDKIASLRVLSCMAHREKAFLVPNQYWTPQQMLSLIGCCHVTIGIRYHFCLFSILQGIPFIALKRSDKVDDLCWDMNWPYGVSLNGLNVSALLDMFSDIEQKRLWLLERLQRCTEVMRERVLRNGAALDALKKQVDR